MVYLINELRGQKNATAPGRDCGAILIVSETNLIVSETNLTTSENRR